MPDTFDEDAPTLTQADFDRAHWRIAGRDVSRAEWQNGVQSRIDQQLLTVQLDTPIVEHFKALAGSHDYRILINSTLRRVIESDHLEADLRRIIREELKR
jgi:hypothetical protein